MSRRTNAYRGSFAPKRLPAKRKARRTELRVVAFFALGIAMTVSCLLAGYVYIRNDRDWTAVASVNGHDISREALRGRMEVLAFLTQQRQAFISKEALLSEITPSESTALSAAASAPLADLVTTARESLIDDELLRQLAAREGIEAPPNVDPWAEATDFASRDFVQRVRYVRFGLPQSGSGSSSDNGASGAWPQASAQSLLAATEQLRTELQANTPLSTITSGLSGAGWQVTGAEVQVSRDGAPSNPSLELDPSIAAGALQGKTNEFVGPTTDVYGRVSMGRLLGTVDTAHERELMERSALDAKVDVSAMWSWANGQVLERAARSALLARWSSKPTTQAHFREIVIGPAPGSTATAGPWVELSSLALDRLASVDPAKIPGAPAGLRTTSDSITGSLRSLTPAQRSALWRELVGAANASGGSTVSGEIGFATKDQLQAEVSKSAFDAKVKTGDILGPIATAAGPQLFLVESRYSGPLDERSQAAIAQVRADANADPSAYTAKFSPDDAVLAADAGWRAKAEFASSESVAAALFETPIGSVSDPFVLDGKLALAVVSERRDGTADARMLDRLTLDGYDAWLATERTSATITRNPRPLPELAAASPSASASPTASPSTAVTTPAIPGLPTPSPIKTDALGLPVIP